LQIRKTLPAKKTPDKLSNQDSRLKRAVAIRQTLAAEKSPDKLSNQDSRLKRAGAIRQTLDRARLDQRDPKLRHHVNLRVQDRRLDNSVTNQQDSRLKRAGAIKKTPDLADLIRTIKTPHWNS